MKPAKSKRIAIALTVVFSFMAAVCILIALGVTEITKTVYDEDNTNEYTAIYLRTEETENKKGYLVYLDGYECAFHVSKATLASKENLEALNSGTAVTFRIFNVYKDILQNPQGVYIPLVALNAGEAEIVSLASSNRRETINKTKVKIGGCIFGAAFLAGAIVCAIQLGKLCKKN